MNSAIPREGSMRTSWPVLRNGRCTFDPEPRHFYSVFMPHQTEPNANNALAVVIRGMLPSCTVLPETTQVFPDHPGRHADVLITAQGSSPVAVEAEYDPAPEVEQDARERLGLVVAHEPRPIEAAIAVRYPTAVESAYDLAEAISDAQLSFCVLYDDGSRFPQSGWLTGSVTVRRQCGTLSPDNPHRSGQGHLPVAVRGSGIYGSIGRFAGQSAIERLTGPAARTRPALVWHRNACHWATTDGAGTALVVPLVARC